LEGFYQILDKKSILFMINIKKLTKKYEGQTIVDGIDLEIKKGSIFGFLGPNGAGKTTFLKMIVGLSLPSSGKIEFDGKSIAKNLIGYMPEDPYFYDRLNATEFIDFVKSLFSGQKTLATKECLEMVGLSEVADKPIYNFSKGMKQRLGLAQAIINDPEYLFLDEPLDGLDPIGRLEFKKIILKLKSQGKTVFFNSHILSDVEEICDAIGILDNGKLIYSGSVRGFSGKEPLEKRFVEVINKQAKSDE
jgi:ABC-2 type transport system ATP-binding protein